MIKELVVISGKGGTGKTTLVASLADLAENKVLADCDVDAADLHLILHPRIRHTQDFTAGSEARIIEDRCVSCGECYNYCRFGAVRKLTGPSGDIRFIIDPIACEGCGVCVQVCSSRAIAFTEKTCGQWFISDTDHGPMVHARLGIAEENSGKLVTLVRQESRRLAKENGLDLIITDGPPGIGCPVIASLTGASLLLIVTEPTFSGLHDMQRVVDLAHHFKVPALVCINKYDINPEMTQKIEDFCREYKLPTVGQFSYDDEVTRAQLAGVSIVQYDRGPVPQQIRSLWQNVSEHLSFQK